MPHLVCHHSLESRGITSNHGPPDPRPSAPEIYSHRAELIKRNKETKKKFSSRMIGVSFTFGLHFSHLAKTPARSTEMNVQTPKGRDNVSVFHEYDETFSLTDVMTSYLITRHTAGGVLSIWLPFHWTCFPSNAEGSIFCKNTAALICMGSTAHGTQHANEEKAIWHQSYHFSLY